MSKLDLVPAYFDGEPREGTPVFLKTRDEIKRLRRTGALHGGYQQNGAIFVIYRPHHERSLDEIERAVIASTMRTAWVTKQSGYAGPLVMQMRTSMKAEATV